MGIKYTANSPFKKCQVSIFVGVRLWSVKQLSTRNKDLFIDIGISRRFLWYSFDYITSSREKGALNA